MDIATRLGIPPANVVRTPFYRPMLSLNAARAPDSHVERVKVLAKCLLAGGTGTAGLDGGGAAVVYVTLQKTAEEVANALAKAGVDARPYHAGLQPAEREVAIVFFFFYVFGEKKGFMKKPKFTPVVGSVSAMTS